MFNETEHRNLIEDLKSELSGDLLKSVIPLYMEPGEYDALLIKKAVDGIGYNRDLLIEVLFTRTNKQLQEMQEAWKKHLNVNRDMYSRVEDETKKFMSGNHFQQLCLNILKCTRSNKNVDQQQVERDADELNRMVISGKEKEAKTRFVEIFSDRSWKHIALMAEAFEKISKKYTLKAAIEHRFGENCDTTQALCVLSTFCQQPYDYWAEKLRAAMKGLGTNDDLLIRVVVSRCEIDLFNVRDVFGLRYGDGKSLKNWIEEDTSGAYRTLLYKLCGY